jgi:hypothetical protein
MGIRYKMSDGGERAGPLLKPVVLGLQPLRSQDRTMEPTHADISALSLAVTSHAAGDRSCA